MLKFLLALTLGWGAPCLLTLQSGFKLHLQHAGVLLIYKYVRLDHIIRVFVEGKLLRYAFQILPLAVILGICLNISSKLIGWSITKIQKRFFFLICILERWNASKGDIGETKATLADLAYTELGRRQRYAAFGPRLLIWFYHTPRSWLLIWLICEWYWIDVTVVICFA